MQPKKWTHFTEKEVEGLDHEFVAKLDQARHIAGIPFVITSGRRDERGNHAVGGKNHSAHLNGLAVDISCKSSNAVNLIVSAAITVGINRHGIYIRYPQPGLPIEYTHIHLDIDTEKPQNRTWIDICKGRLA